MKMNRVFLLLCLLLVTVGVHSQNVKPDFRVVISTATQKGEDETTPKDKFKVGEAIKLKVEITNLSSKRINVPKGIDYSRPTLFRDGQLVPYRKEVTDRERRNYRSLTGMLYPKPNEMQSEVLDLSDFYEPLEPGRYQLSLARRFFKTNIVSNTVLFEVVPNAEPDLKVVISTVIDSGEDETTPKAIFKVGEAIKVKVEIANLSNEVVGVPEGRVYSSPTLFNKGKLVSYHKDANERFKKGQYITPSRNILPNQSRSEILDLNEYYEPLGPGRYQLSLERSFFKVGDTLLNIPSNGMIFEVVSCSKIEN